MSKLSVPLFARLSLKFICLLILAGALLPGIFGQTAASTGSPKDTWGIIPVIVPIYTPETRWMIAGGGIWWLNPWPEAKRERLHEIMAFASASELGQYSFGIYSELYFLRHRLKIMQKSEGYYEPYRFWGLGARAEKSAEEDYLPRGLLISSSAMWLVAHDMYLGPMWNTQIEEISLKKEGGILDRCGFRGCDRSRANGPGIHFLWDTRDNPFYPRAGFWLEAMAWMSEPAFAAEGRFIQSTLDLRWYFPVFQKMVLALNVYSVLTSGDPPLVSLPMLGGQFRLRGFFEGRYIDRNLLTGQAELRFPIWWRIGATVFAGTGDVGYHFPDFAQPKFAGGAGLRVLLDREQQLNLRMDLGFNNEDDTNFYFSFKEAF